MTLAAYRKDETLKFASWLKHGYLTCESCGGKLVRGEAASPAQPISPAVDRGLYAEGLPDDTHIGDATSIEVDKDQLDHEPEGSPVPSLPDQQAA